MRLMFQLLAPALAVGVFWFGFESAWMTILAYHAQILFWSRQHLATVVRGRGKGVAAAVVVTFGAGAGPLLFLVLPRVTAVDSTTWLAAHGLSGAGLVCMIPYFGIVHPVLEQAHWNALRNRTPWAHGCFAGYHLLVLHALLPSPWLGLVFALLVTVSFIWYRLARRFAGAFVPCCMHIAADLGIVLAAWLQTRKA